MANQNKAVKFCVLQRDAGVKWETGVDWVHHSDGDMYPAIYEECVYNLRKAQNKFLNDLLEMENWWIHDS